MNLHDYVISSLPKTVIYIPNFITTQEESEILNKVYSVPKPKWTQLKNRRLQNWGGIPHIKGMIPEKIPEWLQKYLNKINSLDIFEKNHLPNHVFVNEYTAGQGIMPHVDGPLFYPIITTVNCGSHTLLNFQPNYIEKNSENPKSTGELFSLLLEPRSLLILKDNLYTDYMHGIEEKIKDEIHENVANLNSCGYKYKTGEYINRTTRVSLTIRNVPRSLNFKLAL